MNTEPYHRLQAEPSRAEPSQAALFNNKWKTNWAPGESELLHSCFYNPEKVFF